MKKRRGKGKEKEEKTSSSQHSGLGSCECACACMWRPECHFLGVIHLVLWDTVSHWTRVSRLVQAGWPLSPKNPHVFLPALGLQMNAIMPLWVLGIKLRSSCLHSKHSVYWDINPAPWFPKKSTIQQGLNTGSEVPILKRLTCTQIF